MKAFLFLNGYYNNFKIIKNDFKNDDIVVGVDGGLNFLIQNNLLNRIDFAIGDFDSFENPENYLKKDKIVRFKREKDFTDALGAFIFLRRNFNKKIDEYHFFGVSGRREDHFLSLIFSFYKFKEKIIFHSNLEDIFFLHKGEHILNIGKGTTFSIFPLNKVKNLRLENSKYVFKNKNISLTGIGVSNLATKDNIKINLEKGIILVTILRNNLNRLITV
jgi:thiamine pyrophosphokinase